MVPLGKTLAGGDFKAKLWSHGSVISRVIVGRLFPQSRSFVAFEIMANNCCSTANSRKKHPLMFAAFAVHPPANSRKKHLQ
jgi:hypothetical protein